MSPARWTAALRRCGTPEPLVSSWGALRAAVQAHQRLLTDNGIGVEVCERERVRVNARRVGLQAPMFADEAEASGTFGDVVGRVFEQRLGKGAGGASVVAEAERARVAAVKS